MSQLQLIRKSQHLPHPPGMLPCLLPPDSNDEDEYNDENYPEGVAFSPRSDLDDCDDLPAPIAPPRKEVLFAAQTYNHGSLERTPPRRHDNGACSNSAGRKMKSHEGTPSRSGYEKTPPRVPDRHNATPQNLSTSATHRRTHSLIDEAPSQNNSKSQDGYNSDTLNARSRTAFARRKERTTKNALLKNIKPAFDNLRTEGSMMEKLFGDVVKNPEPSSEPSDISPPLNWKDVRSRKLVPSSLYLSDSTHLWIVTVDTNNGGWKTETSTLQAFSFSTLEEAREAAYSYAPPVLSRFDESPTCYSCHGKFALFRRPAHCKSCGVCVCRKCVVQWPAKRLPQTYNHKRESKLNVCLSCNHISENFQDALLRGNEDEALELYETGNVNLRCPFGKDEHGEVLFPIHCAVRGGNLNLVRWLVDVHYCPIFMTQLTNNKDTKEGNDEASKQPLLSSKGRSALYHAMSSEHIDIVRYLVFEKGMSLFETKDLRTSLLNLSLALERLPPLEKHGDTRLLTARTTLYDNIVISKNHERNGDDPSGFSNDSFEPETLQVAAGEEDEEDDATVTTVNDACIICFVNVIDCVVLPCGHQICCANCAKSMNLCPICNIKCSFVKIFNP